jgi:hypothetical protein
VNFFVGAPSGPSGEDVLDPLAQRLAGFDHAVHGAIEQDGAGLVVLVETFSGKRNYYAYVADDSLVKRSRSMLIR